jgi:hypothetical protein
MSDENSNSKDETLSDPLIVGTDDADVRSVVKPSNPLKRGIVKVGISCALILSIVLILLIFASNTYSPEAVVKSYVELISSGEFQKATLMVEPGFTNSIEQKMSELPLLDADKRISNIKLGESIVGGDRAEVTVTYDIGDLTTSTSFLLENKGKNYIFFDDWTISNPLVRQIVIGCANRLSDGPGECFDGTFTMNGLEFSSPTETYYSYFVYPAVYEVSKATTKYFQGDSATVFPGPGLVSRGILVAHPNDVVKQEISTSLNNQFRNCVSNAKGPNPYLASGSSCSLFIPSQYISTYDESTISRFGVTNLEWHFGNFVGEVSLGQTGDFSYIGGEVYFTYKHIGYSGVEKDYKSDSVPVFIRGKLEISGDSYEYTLSESPYYESAYNH